MKLALITGGVPAANMAHQYMQSYKFLLPQKLSQEYGSENYRALKMMQRRGYFRILDNGAPEGQLQDNAILIEAYNLVQPDEFILPDILEDAKKTIELANAFTKEHGDKVPPRKRMIVPQGESLAEWCNCLDKFAGNPYYEFATIGVPKHLEGKEGGRVEALQHIERMEYHRCWHVHMLGCFQDPVKEVRLALSVAPWVRGIDTAAPFAYAQQELDIQCGYHIGYEWGKPFDEEMASYNIDKLLRACAGG